MPNCRGCNAPIPTTNAQCPYCGVANDLDLQGLSSSGAPQEGKRKCPACKAPMTVRSAQKQGKTINIDQCNKCFGIFLDNGELEVLISLTLIAPIHIDHKGLAEFNRQRELNTTVQYRPCPDCAKVMNHENFGKVSGIVIDRCRDHGLFLDAGELQGILTWWKLGGNLKSAQVRQETIEELSRQEHRKILEKEMQKARQKTSSEDNGQSPSLGRVFDGMDAIEALAHVARLVRRLLD